MYKDIEEICKQIGLDKFEFIIPAAEMTVIEMLGKRMLFAHGHEFKYAGGIGGSTRPCCAGSQRWQRCSGWT